MPSYLDFEKPIAELEGKILELGHLNAKSGLNGRISPTMLAP